MHARLDPGGVKILTRSGNDWSQKYRTIAQVIAGLPAQHAYRTANSVGAARWQNGL